jgi:hypothetical protein
VIGRTADHTRTEEDLRRAAEAQFRALKISADHFDLGEMGEAARMATALFILVGEGMRTHTSILDAADQKERRLYPSTRPAENDLGCPLVQCRLEKVEEDVWDVRLEHAGRAALAGGRDLTFSDWWNEPVVVNDTITLSRNDIVRILRDRNGGAHFDPIMKDPLVAAAIRGEIGLFDIKHHDGTREIVPFGLEFCMRQIATEFWYSVDQNKSFELPYQNNCESRRPISTVAA